MYFIVVVVAVVCLFVFFYIFSANPVVGWHTKLNVISKNIFLELCVFCVVCLLHIFFSPHEFSLKLETENLGIV